RGLSRVVSCSVRAAAAESPSCAPSGPPGSAQRPLWGCRMRRTSGTHSTGRRVLGCGRSAKMTVDTASEIGALTTTPPVKVDATFTGDEEVSFALTRRAGSGDEL